MIQHLKVLLKYRRWNNTTKCKSFYLYGLNYWDTVILISIYSQSKKNNLKWDLFWTHTKKNSFKKWYLLLKYWWVDFLYPVMRLFFLQNCCLLVAFTLLTDWLSEWVKHHRSKVEVLKVTEETLRETNWPLTLSVAKRFSVMTVLASVTACASPWTRNWDTV